MDAFKGMSWISYIRFEHQLQYNYFFFIALQEAAF